MLRIDDNTYIDDTLVTCAEYQLFIDEMRELGQYYQPDHWTLHQFPDGRAREPILGVRHGDAVVFGEWLTKRGAKVWCYRLPTQPETIAFPLKPIEQSDFGYWILESNSVPPHFAFADLSTGNLVEITTYVNRHQDFARKLFVLDLARIDGLIEFLDRESDLIASFDHSSGLHLNALIRIVVDLKTALDRSHIASPRHILELIRALANTFRSDRDKDLDEYRSMYKAIGTDDFAELDQRVSEASFYIFDFIRTLDYSRDKDWFPDRDNRVVAVLDHAIDLFLNMVILLERIAGRSPAFEGIRLVKERIR
jgi:hypothetical protein